MKRCAQAGGGVHGCPPCTGYLRQPERRAAQLLEQERAAQAAADAAQAGRRGGSVCASGCRGTQTLPDVLLRCDPSPSPSPPPLRRPLPSEPSGPSYNPVTGQYYQVSTGRTVIGIYAIFVG